MLPISYDDASVRNVTPVCPSRLRIGIGFDIGDPTPTPLRVALDLEDARQLVVLLQSYINSFAGSQSPGSELSPSALVSVLSDGVNT